MKLDFLVGVIAKALRAAGSDEFRGNQAMLGEVIAWRNLFWALSDAMANNPMPWVGDAVLPNAQSGSSYRVFAGDAYARIKEIVEKIVASSLIYLPSSVKDFKNPAIEPYLARYVRGSLRHRLQGAHQDHEAAVGRDRHRVRRPPRALRDATTPATTRTSASRRCWNARGSGAFDGMIALAEQCMADYDENGWIGDTWVDPDDVAYPGVAGAKRPAE